MPKSTTPAGAAPTATFRVTIQAAGKNAAGIEVPAEVVDGFGAGKRPPVRVTISAHTYESTVAVMGGKYMVGVSMENRKAAGVAAGDTVDVTLELETTPRVVALPADFGKALGKVPAAKKFFEGLSPSMKKFHVTNIEGARTDETRTRRIEKAVAMLAEGRAR